MRQYSKRKLRLPPQRLSLPEASQVADVQGAALPQLCSPLDRYDPVERRHVVQVIAQSLLVLQLTNNSGLALGLISFA